MLILNIIIRILHFILIILIGISPFIDSYKLKNYVLVFLLYLLFQYLSGYQKCGLTNLEYFVMGKKYKEGFLYRLIKPVITVREDYFKKYLLVIHLLYIAILYYEIRYTIT